MSDKRRLARFVVNAPVRILLEDEETARRIQTQTRDVSASGAYLILSHADIDVGTEIELEIDYVVDPREHIDDSPREICISGRGVVTRKEDEGLAVAFAGELRFI